MMSVPSRQVRTTFLVLWLVSIGVVVAGSLLPVPDGPPVPHIDKVEHLIGYAWLALLPWAAFTRPVAASYASLAMVLLGGGIEVAQHFVPGRFASLADMAANALGVACGWFAGRRQARDGWAALRRRLVRICTSADDMSRR
ncbi:vanZ-like family protein [Nitratidesulfovibrio vulgaris str. Hildenborough]|uniref:VanZ-like family protein n=2 Tax=Nitratidesulfovibrio vulgaris TaxID=881 RepID=Q729D3_NITV2|nr:vanZ-like family protein [Nitratidesulfovibrio vulgaris str. Hildenborough]